MTVIFIPSLYVFSFNYFKIVIETYQWIEITPETNLYATDAPFLFVVAKHHKAFDENMKIEDFLQKYIAQKLTSNKKRME
jgi:hypothetical protein